MGTDSENRLATTILPYDFDLYTSDQVLAIADLSRRLLFGLSLYRSVLSRRSSVRFYINTSRAGYHHLQPISGARNGLQRQCRPIKNSSWSAIILWISS